MKYFFLTACLFLTSCNYQHLKNTPSEPIPLEPTFVSIKANIFDVKCQKCHTPGGRGEAILFESREQMLKSIDPMIIIPGDPDNSALVIAIIPGAKKPMPPLRVRQEIPAVTEEQIMVIKEWIKNGAND